MPEQETAANNNNSPPPPTAVNKPSASPPRSRKNLFVAFGFVGILVLGVVAGVYLINRPQDIREEAAIPDPDSYTCPLTAAEGEILIEIKGSVRSSYLPTYGPIGVSIPAGEYSVTLVSHDAHSEKAGQNQPAESYYLKLLANEAEIAQTSPMSDLPDDQDYLTEEVNTNLEVSEDITQLTVQHTAYPSSSPNSVDAVCALFSPAEPPVVAQCLDIKIFDTQWNRLTTDDLAELDSGDTIRFSVSKSTNLGTIDKARFSVNGTTRPETDTVRPGTDEFYDEYTIPDGVNEFSISAELNHSQLGWF